MRGYSRLPVCEPRGCRRVSLCERRTRVVGVLCVERNFGNSVLIADICDVIVAFADPSLSIAPEALTESIWMVCSSSSPTRYFAPRFVRQPGRYYADTTVLVVATSRSHSLLLRLLAQFLSSSIPAELPSKIHVSVALPDLLPTFLTVAITCTFVSSTRAGASTR